MLVSIMALGQEKGQIAGRGKRCGLDLGCVAVRVDPLLGERCLLLRFKWFSYRLVELEEASNVF